MAAQRVERWVRRPEKLQRQRSAQLQRSWSWSYEEAVAAYEEASCYHARRLGDFRRGVKLAGAPAHSHFDLMSRTVASSAAPA